MLRNEWDGLFESLRVSGETIASWEPEPANPNALRCEFSRHRTLAHLRACQEQWWGIVKQFLAKENANVTVLHPWRQFDQNLYAELPWEEHMAAFLEGRPRWLALQATADPERSGKWNRKPDTIGGLVSRLANHEAYHLSVGRWQ